jgi:hypothetical protein
MLLVGSVARVVLLVAPVLVLSTNSLILPFKLTCAVATSVVAANNVAIAIFFIKFPLKINLISQARLIFIVSFIVDIK